MKRNIAMSGPACAAGILFLLVGVVALSAATRRPYLRPSSGSWHICKAGHFTESERHESSVTQTAEGGDKVEAETNNSSSSYGLCVELLPAPLALTVPNNYFRSPPSLP